MGYDPNFVPSRRWFCGRKFIESARDTYEEIDDDSKGIMVLSKLLLARLNVVRGIRAALLLPPDDQTNLEELIESMESKMNENLYKKIADVFLADFFVNYSGTGQYGVPNYDLHDKDGNRASATINTIQLQGLYRKAIKERTDNLKQLIDLGKEVLLSVYLEDKDDEINDYGFTETHDIEYMYDILVSNGLVNSEEDARKKYGDDSDELYEEFQELFDEEAKNEVEMMHDDLFWEWSEEDSIYHGHSN